MATNKAVSSFLSELPVEPSGVVLTPDVTASSVSRAKLEGSVQARPVQKADEGDLLVTRVMEVNPAYPTLETPGGEEVSLTPGQVIVGVAGTRKALRGFSGAPPRELHPRKELYLLNKGGVIGECSAFHRDLEWPTRLEYLGTLHQNGRPLNLKEFCLPLQTGPLPETPVILVVGTCMNAGKTSVCKQVVRLFSDKGFSVNAGKVAGVACLRDVLAMRRSGAQEVLSFLDLGYPSTTGLDDLASVGRSLVHYLSRSEPDFIVLELGDGILGGYSVATLFEDRELLDRSFCTILCANDLLGVWGGVQWLRERGLGVDDGHRLLISGPVTDSEEGIRYVEENWSLPAANAFDSAGKMCTLLLESLMPWLELE